MTDKLTEEQKALRARFLAEHQTENAWLVFGAQEQTQRALRWAAEDVRSEVGERVDEEVAISEAVVEAFARVRGELSELVLTGLRAYADTLDAPRVEVVVHASRADALDAPRVEVVVHASRADAEQGRASDPMTLAFARPWRKVEGSQLCEAGVVVMRAADRLCPGWPERHEWLERLVRRDGAEAWLDDEFDGSARPSLVARLLVAAAAAAHELRRLKTGDVPWVHPLTWAPLARRPVKDGKTEAVPLAELVSARHPEGQVRMGLDGLATVWLPDETPDYPETYWTAAMVLVVHLARKVWKQWKAGKQDYQRVRLAIGQNTRPRGIGERIDIQRLLDMLQKVKAGGMRLVVEGSVNVVVGLGQKGGPEVELFVGDPLCPYGVTAWRQREGITLPSALNYNGAVLDPDWAPLVPGSDTRTRALQMACYSIGPLAYAMSRREEYAEKGGVTFDGLPPLLRAMGLSLYRRTHSDLNERVIDAWKTPPTQLVLGRPTTALWVPVEGDTKRWRLSDGHPEYVAAHDMILDASEVPQRRRKLEAIKQRLKKAKK